jgi:hydroxymethylpyrimidine/phosphomethylpyrimidine kinase
MTATRSVLVASGVDPAGGAGLAVDIAFLSRLGVRALPLVTCLTVQDDNSVSGVEATAETLLAAMAAAAVRVAGPSLRAIKIGLVPDRAVATRLAAIARELRCPVVLDPIMAAGTGDTLHSADPITILMPLLEISQIALPNRHEAERLAGQVWDGTEAGLLALARALATPTRTIGVSAGDRDGASVPLAIAGPGWEQVIWAPRVAQVRTHGTGCALAASVAGYLAAGLPPAEAISAAHRFVSNVIAASHEIPERRRSPEPWRI